MKRLLALSAGAVISSILTMGSIAQAAGKPSVTITSPRNGAVIHGSTLSVTVAVQNFKLVAPLLKNPPVLKGDEGHLHYVLDSLANFVVTRDATASLNHTWTHIAPGPHTVTVYLASAQHAVFPGARPAQIAVTLAPPVVTHPRTRVSPKHSPGVRRGPTTGGAVGVDTISHSPLNGSLVLAALLAIILGAGMIGRRFAFSTHSGTSGTAASAEESEPSTPRLAEFSQPASPVSSDVERLPDEPPESSADAELPVTATEVPPQASAGDLNPVEGIMAPESTFTDEGSTDSRRQAVIMARQWGQMVEDLVAQLDRAEAERHDLQARIAALEEAVRAGQSLRERVQQLAPDALSAEEMDAVRSVTDSLVRDPDHIVVLAAVAVQAQVLHRMAAEYAHMRQVIDES